MEYHNSDIYAEPAGIVKQKEALKEHKIKKKEECAKLQAEFIVRIWDKHKAILESF